MTALDLALFFNARADALESEADALADESAAWRRLALAALQYSRELWLQNRALTERVNDQQRQLRELLDVTK